MAPPVAPDAILQKIQTAIIQAADICFGYTRLGITPTRNAD